MAETGRKVRVRAQALPKQVEFLKAASREVIYSGAFGAGKSWSTAMKVAMRAAHPGAREGLCRKTLVQLRSTTLVTLLQGDGKLPPVLPVGSYAHHKSDRIIDINGGGQIVYFGLDPDPQTGQPKIGSMNLSGCGIDQAEELTLDDYTFLRGRVRVDHPMGNQIYGACNPSTPSHWIAERFGLAMGHEPADGCQAIRTRTPDNFFLPKDYVADLAALPGLARKRFYEGLWVGSEGLVYDRWDRSRHVQARTGPWVRRILTVDEGYTNPFVLLEICEDALGRLHIAREFYKSKLTERPKVDKVLEWYEDHEAIVVDPSAADLIAALRDVGLPVREADNTVFDGIVGVQGRLAGDIDGRPALTVEPDCVEVCREYETYEWRDGRLGTKDEPVKANDHSMDAIRYGVRHIDGGGAVTIQPVGFSVTVADPTGYDPYQDDRLWETA